MFVFEDVVELLLSAREMQQELPGPGHEDCRSPHEDWNTIRDVLLNDLCIALYRWDDAWRVAYQKYTNNNTNRKYQKYVQKNLKLWRKRKKIMY